MKSLLYIGLDVHKDSISIAVAEPGRNGEIRSWGKITNSLHALDKVIARLRKQYGADVQLHFCYSQGIGRARDRLPGRQPGGCPDGSLGNQRRSLWLRPRPSFAATRARRALIECKPRTGRTHQIRALD